MSNKAYYLSLIIVGATISHAHQAHTPKLRADYKQPHDPKVMHPGFPLEPGLLTMWESRYVSEGRDNLDGDSLASVEATLGYSGFELGVWAAESPERDYTEYNYWLAYSYEWVDFTLSVGYTFLDFTTDDANDEEYSAQVAWALPQNFELVVVGYYSIESEGAFYEVGLSKSFAPSESLSFVPFGTVGYNNDYISEGHNGWNHLALGLEAALELDEHFTLSGFLAGNLAIVRDEGHYADDVLLKDFLYMGLNITYSY